jgi:hypothetical protein
VEHLLGADFSSGLLVARRKGGERRLVGHVAPQERGHFVFLDALQAQRNSGAAEVFLRHDIAGDLAPGFRDLYVLLAEDDGAIGIADFARRLTERNALVG